MKRLSPAGRRPINLTERSEYDCPGSVVTAWNARSPLQRNGGCRIELCAAPRPGLHAFAGRLTQRARHITIPVHPIIRPRGEVYYTDGRFAAMLEDIRLVRVNFGLVTGVDR